LINTAESTLSQQFASGKRLIVQLMLPCGVGPGSSGFVKYRREDIVSARHLVNFEEDKLKLTVLCPLGSGHLATARCFRRFGFLLNSRFLATSVSLRQDSPTFALPQGTINDSFLLDCERQSIVSYFEPFFRGCDSFLDSIIECRVRGRAQDCCECRV
jgi:hypothetical protein